MKIVLVTDAWTPQLNGVVNTLQNTIACLREQGHAVDVIEPSQFPGIAVWLLKGLRLALPPYGLGPRLSAADAIHIATEGPLGVAAKLICDRERLPYSTAFHTNYAVYFHKTFGLPHKYGFWFLRWFHGNSRAMMVPSQSLIDELVGRGFTNAVRWGRGVDSAVFHPRTPLQSCSMQNATPSWLYVGRISREKNLEAFLDLDLPGEKVLVGDGPDIGRLMQLYPAAQFVGVKRGHELASYYRAANVFVFPSKFDTFGLVVAEAIACGTPVAAFDVAGPKDIVRNGITGFVDNDLKAACMRALMLSDVRQDFSWTAATDEFVQNLQPML